MPLRAIHLPGRGAVRKRKRENRQADRPVRLSVVTGVVRIGLSRTAAPPSVRLPPAVEELRSRTAGLNGLHSERNSADFRCRWPGDHRKPVLMRIEDCRWREGRVCAGNPGGVSCTIWIKRFWSVCKSAQNRLSLYKQAEAPAAVAQPGPYLARETVSRVLYLTVIYLDAPLPVRSSHLLRTAGPAICPFHGVAPDRVYSDGHSRAVGCALTAPFHPYQGG